MTLSQQKPIGLPPIVSQAEWQRQLMRSVSRKRRPRRPAMRSPPSAAGCRWSKSKNPTNSPPERQSAARRPVRRPPATAPLSLHVRPERATAGRRGLSRLLDVHRPVRPPVPSARPRHVLLPRLARAAGQHRAIQKAHGLDPPLGLVGRHRLQSRTSASRPKRARRTASASFCATAIRLPHVLHGRSRRRDARQRLDVPRPDAARPPGRLGRFSQRAAADGPLPMVAPPRRIRNQIRRMLLVSAAISETAANTMSGPASTTVGYECRDVGLRSLRSAGDTPRECRSASRSRPAASAELRSTTGSRPMSWFTMWLAAWRAVQSS